MPEDQQRQRGKAATAPGSLRVDQGAKVLQPEGQRGNQHQRQRPQRPESARQTFRPKPASVRRIGQTSDFSGGLGGPVISTCLGPDQSDAYSHVGMVSRLRISSKLGRARMTAK
jgi:hypothetical protein